MWNEEDIEGFKYSSYLNIGQINLDNRFGQLLKEYSSKSDIKTILEVGTWNGLGSTRCIYEGLKDRNDNCILYSLEINKEKLEFAKKQYNTDKIKFCHATVLKEIPTSSELFQITKDKDYNEKYLNIDIENIKSSQYFFKNNSELIFDLVLLDGGSLTYFEYLVLKDKTTYLFLDDTNDIKCRKIRDELINNNLWETIADVSNERNGWAIFKKIKSF